jgi:hypothetical protein
MKFNEDMNWSNFSIQNFQTITIDSDMYTLSMFNISYEILSNSSYRIVMQPKGYIFLYNATISCTTMDFPGIVNINRSENGRPFKESNYGRKESIVWFVIKAPDMTDT